MINLRALVAAMGSGSAIPAPHALTTGDWEGSTASFTISSGTVTCSASDKAIRTISGLIVTGDFSWTGTIAAHGNQATFGIYDTAEDATFNQNADNGAMASMTNSFYVRGDNVKKGGTDVDTVAYGTADTFEIRRVGSTITVYRNDGLEHTFAAGSSAAMRIVVASGGVPDYPDYDDLLITYL